MTGLTMTNAIETEYGGDLFRSRLEARWAYFFDLAGINWQYEPQGFDVHEGMGCYGAPHSPTCFHRRYLPDFFLRDLNLWVEVKGHVTPNDLQTLAIASLDSRGGLPTDPEGTPVTDSGRNRLRVLLLSDIPVARHGVVPVHYATYFNKGDVTIQPVRLDHISDNAWETVRELGLHRPTDWLLYSDVPEWGPLDIIANHINNEPYMNDGGRPSRFTGPYRAARQARFEHGQTPQRPV